MTFVDYYKILNVDKSATTKDIRDAYRKLARKFHPDLNLNDKDAKAKFQQINEANEVLLIHWMKLKKKWLSNLPIQKPFPAIHFLPIFIRKPTKSLEKI